MLEDHLKLLKKNPLLMKLYETYVYLYIVDLSMYVSCRLLCDKEEIIFISLGKLICRVDSIYCTHTNIGLQGHTISLAFSLVVIHLQTIFVKNNILLFSCFLVDFQRN